MVAAPKPKHVLVLEDDPTCVATLEFTLRSAGLKVSVATKAVDALVLARQRQFDLVISDYLLPDYPGTDFIRLLRKGGQYEDVPVILFTARADELDQQRLFEDLFVLILAKGCSSKCLLTAVFKCLAAVRCPA